MLQSGIMNLGSAVTFHHNVMTVLPVNSASTNIESKRFEREVEGNMLPDISKSLREIGM